jgi:uncharacterized protein YgbK (DUF1537 family)
MDALVATVTSVADLADLVIAKGGITSAEVATRGLGARTATVLGQVEPGISLWQLDTGMPYLVVPGNIGSTDTLTSLVNRLVHR